MPQQCCINSIKNINWNKICNKRVAIKCLYINYNFLLQYNKSCKKRVSLSVCQSANKSVNPVCIRMDQRNKCTKLLWRVPMSGVECIEVPVGLYADSTVSFGLSLFIQYKEIRICLLVGINYKRKLNKFDLYKMYFYLQENFSRCCWIALSI